MAEARYPCPECGATLKLANEVPAGKKIKCPKCQAIFAPVAEVKAKPKPAPAKPKPKDDDEDGVGTYGVVSDPHPSKQSAGDDDEEEKKSSHEELQERLEKKFPKSRRGPAQALVTKSANQLLATSSFTCVSCILSVIVALWPLFFSKSSTDPDAKLTTIVYSGNVLRVSTKNPDSPAAADLAKLGDVEIQKDGRINLEKYGTIEVGGKKLPEVEGAIKQTIEKFEKSVGPIEVAIQSQRNAGFYWLWISTAVAAFAYNGLIVYGAVSMQNVESYNWAMAGSFLMLAPSNWALCVPAFGWFFLFVKSLAGDEVLYGAIAAISIWCLYVGIWNVMTLRNPEVEAGFRQKAEAD